MTLLRKHRLLPTLLLPLLAATLACNALAGVGASPGAALTQAAATNRAGTQQVDIPPTLAQSTQAPTAVPPTAPSTPTPAATVTRAASLTAAASLTPAPGSTGVTNPTAVATATVAEAGASAIVDPCSLITADEAHTLVGLDLQPARQQGSGCIYSDRLAAHGLAVFALPPSQAQGFFQQYVAGLKQIGITVDPAAEAKLNQDLAAGDLVAATNDLIGMTAGQTKVKAQKLDGLGSTAQWSFSALDQLQVVDAGLIAAKPGAAVVLSLVVAAPAQEAQLQAAMKPFVSRILAGLPPAFLVSGLQIAGSAPAIDPCSLATSDEVQAILGAKPGAAQAAQGECFYVSSSNPQVQVRVFALPPGEGAAEALKQVESGLLVNNTAAQTQIDADVKAGDFVAAVNHLAALPPGMLGKPETIAGLGDAAMFVIGAPGGASLRIAYLLAARPGALVGLTLLLKPGDNAPIKAASIALVTNILANLPDKFTVTGAP